jgi:hypothetical protein
MSRERQYRLNPALISPALISNLTSDFPEGDGGAGRWMAGEWPDRHDPSDAAHQAHQNRQNHFRYPV